jgi:hypothetical protein
MNFQTSEFKNLRLSCELEERKKETEIRQIDAPCIQGIKKRWSLSILDFRFWISDYRGQVLIFL